jgi:hypothetical protein
MNIHELDSYDLGDAVKFNDQLNPRLWGADEKLRPEVREQLLRIADDFREFLGINVEVQDITISGSNAAYTYTPHSDIDLHLVVDLPQADASEVYRELFDAKKYAYNDQHNIKIGGYDVELYVQDARKPHISQGIYSVKNNDWVAVPKRRKPDVNDISVQSKFEDLGHRIESAIASGDYEKISDMARKVKEYRQAGLDQHGEFGPENLAFKILRKQGLIQKLYDARNAAKDQQLSLDERRKKKTKKKVRYGYGGYWYPGTAYAGQDQPAGTEGGGDGGGGESVHEARQSTTDTISDFVNFCAAQLELQVAPQVRFRRDPAWSARNKTFGRFNHETNQLEVSLANRHVMDILRTVAHELTHQRQSETADMPDHAGTTGSEWENEANSAAGILMRQYAEQHPELFVSDTIEEGIKSRAAAAAMSAALMGAPDASAQSLGQIIGAGRDIGATVQQAQRISRAGVDAELEQEFRNFVRGLGGDAGGQNQSHLWQLFMKKKQQQQPSTAPGTQTVPSDDPKAGYYNPPQALKPDATNESASGYIPTKKQARDPRFSMALTQDIRPGQLGKEANKLKLKTDRQGHPQIARPSGLVEALTLEFARFKADEDYSPPCVWMSVTCTTGTN